MTLEVYPIRVLRDNYSFVVRDTKEGVTAVIDPGDALPVIHFLELRGWRPKLILNTHHHADHIGGNRELKNRYGAQVVGSRGDKGRILELDRLLVEGDRVAIGSSEFRVMVAPGHTHGHILYYNEADGILFSGDVLFHLSCGAVFEGTATQMVASLAKIYELPDATHVYCGHEYTHMFIGFAVRIDPKNALLQKIECDVKTKYERGEPTIPFELGDDKRANPYLRIFDSTFAQVIGAESGSPLELFHAVSKLDQ